MKKTILVFSFLAGIVNANAQVHAEFGLKGGLNVASLHSNNATDFKSIIGFHAGGLVHVHLSKMFALQPEVTYSTQGAKLPINNVENTFDINYINIPVLLQFMGGKGFRVETGPQLGILTTAHRKIGGVSYSEKDAYNSTDFSWAVGVGYLTSSNVGFDARYNLGIGDISKSSGVKTVNNVLQLGLFYQFK